MLLVSQGFIHWVYSFYFHLKKTVTKIKFYVENLYEFQCLLRKENSALISIQYISANFFCKIKWTVFESDFIYPVNIPLLFDQLTFDLKNIIWIIETSLIQQFLWHSICPVHLTEWWCLLTSYKITSHHFVKLYCLLNGLVSWRNCFFLFCGCYSCSSSKKKIRCCFAFSLSLIY